MALVDTLNDVHLSVFDEVMSIVDSEHAGLLFVDGTGKTYMYKAFLTTMCNQNKINVATTTSSVVVSLMPSSRTVSLTMRE